MNIVSYQVNKDLSKTYNIVLFEEVDDELLELLSSLNKSLNIITFKDLDWYKDFSPYPSGKFLGQGDKTLDLVKEYLYQHSIKDYFVVGYSLGGLLALYSLTKLDGIIGCGSVSGSLWYEFFDEFICNKNIKNKNIYISLGDKEAKTSNRLLKTVLYKTSIIVEELSKNNRVCFKINKGGHFDQANERIMWAIDYLINRSLKQ